jgi:hypothetical protein
MKLEPNRVCSPVEIIYPKQKVWWLRDEFEFELQTKSSYRSNWLFPKQSSDKRSWIKSRKDTAALLMLRKRACALTVERLANSYGDPIKQAGPAFLVGVGTLNPKLENPTEPNPNNPNCRFIQVSRFGFGPNKFIIRSSVSVLVVYNPNRPNNMKFNIVAYFDSNYDVTTLCFKLFFEFFINLLVTCFSRVVLN